MIEKITKESLPELLSYLKLNPVDNIYGLSYAENLPLDDRFYKAYKFDNGFVVIRDNIAFSYGALTDELYYFFDMLGINFLYSFEAPEKEFSVINETEVLFAKALSKPDKNGITEEANEILVYELLSSCFDNFPSFEDYRNNRIEQRCYLKSFSSHLTEGKKVLSTACVSMSNSLSGLITSVATDKNYLNKGFASKVVSYIGNKLIDDGKIPVIISDDFKVLNIYKKIGFEFSSKIYISYKE